MQWPRNENHAATSLRKARVSLLVRPLREREAHGRGLRSSAAKADFCWLTLAVAVMAWLPVLSICFLILCTLLEPIRAPCRQRLIWQLTPIPHSIHWKNHFRTPAKAFLTGTAEAPSIFYFGVRLRSTICQQYRVPAGMGFPSAPGNPPL